MPKIAKIAQIKMNKMVKRHIEYGFISNIQQNPYMRNIWGFVLTRMHMIFKEQELDDDLYFEEYLLF